MAIRVLATIPDLSPKASRQVPRGEKVAPEPTARTRSVRSADRPQHRRRKSRAIFPSGSITVLAVIAAAIWSYVAIRDMGRPEPSPTTARIAVEPGSLGTETTRR